MLNKAPSRQVCDRTEESLDLDDAEQMPSWVSSALKAPSRQVWLKQSRDPATQTLSPMEDETGICDHALVEESQDPDQMPSWVRSAMLNKAVCKGDLERAPPCVRSEDSERAPTCVGSEDSEQAPTCVGSEDTLFDICAAGVHGNVRERVRVASRFVSVNEASAGNMTPLFVVCACDRVEFFAALMDVAGDRLDVNRGCITNEQSPLHAACISDAHRCAALLLGDDRTDVNFPDASGQTPLHVACGSGAVACMSLLLSEGRVGVNCPDRKGHTPLHVACAANNPGRVTLLVSGAMTPVDINARNNEGLTALAQACALDSDGSISELMAASNDRIDIDTALDCTAPGGLIFMICLCGSDRTLRAVLNNAAGQRCIVDGAQGVHQRTPLHAACEAGNHGCVSVLLSVAGRRVDVNARTVRGETALFLACLANRFACIEALLAHAAPDPNLTDSRLRTPLLAACVAGAVESVTALLTLGDRVDVNLACDDGRAPLFAACADGHTACAKALLDGAGSRLNVNHRVGGSATALLAACFNGHIDCVRVLFAEAGSRLDVDAPARNGGGPIISPLEAACAGGHALCVAELLRCARGRVNVNYRSDNGAPLLVTICFQNKYDCVAAMLAHACDLIHPNAIDSDGVPALIAACLTSRPQLIELLLDSFGDRIDVNMTHPTSGAAALHVVCALNGTECLRVLLGKASGRVNCAQEDAQGYAPLDVAAARGNYDCVRVLLEHDYRLDLAFAMHVARAGKHTTCMHLLQKARDYQVLVLNTMVTTAVTTTRRKRKKGGRRKKKVAAGALDRESSLV